MSRLLRHRRLLLPVGLAAFLAGVALLALPPQSGQQAPAGKSLSFEAEISAPTPHAGQPRPQAAAGASRGTPRPAGSKASLPDPAQVEAETRRAAENRQQLIGRNIASLEEAATVAEAEGNPQRAELMGRRAEILTARLHEP